MRFQLAHLVVPSALALAGVLLLGPTPAARADDLTVGLAVHEHGFEPAQIEAVAGSRIRLEITNHTPAAIEFESFELNRERVVQPGQTAAVYVSGLAAGRYEFFDDFHQQRRGALLVR